MYCVFCGVELEQAAHHCPLCGTEVWCPGREEDACPTFPPVPEPIGPASKLEVAVLLSVMLATAAAACLVLNLFLNQSRMWSLYPAGACGVLWVWFVPGLLARKIPLWLRLLIDAAVVGAYVSLIAMDLSGWDWLLRLAVPILLAATAGLMAIGLVLGDGRRSLLTSITMLIGMAGLFLFLVELFIDRYLSGLWQPGWSLVCLVVSAALVVPLIVVRRVPRLREEARRRFHL